MVNYQELTDEQWSVLKPLLPYGFTNQRGRNTYNRRSNSRRFFYSFPARLPTHPQRVEVDDHLVLIQKQAREMPYQRPD